MLPRVPISAPVHGAAGCYCDPGPPPPVLYYSAALPGKRPRESDCTSSTALWPGTGHTMRLFVSSLPIISWQWRAVRTSLSRQWQLAGGSPDLRPDEPPLPIGNCPASCQLPLPTGFARDIPRTLCYHPARIGGGPHRRRPFLLAGNGPCRTRCLPRSAYSP